MVWAKFVKELTQLGADRIMAISVATEVTIVPTEAYLIGSHRPSKPCGASFLPVELALVIGYLQEP